MKDSKEFFNLRKEESTHEEGELNQEIPSLHGVSVSNSSVNKSVLYPINKDMGIVSECITECSKKAIDFEMNGWHSLFWSILYS